MVHINENRTNGRSVRFRLFRKLWRCLTSPEVLKLQAFPLGRSNFTLPPLAGFLEVLIFFHVGDHARFFADFFEAF